VRKTSQTASLSFLRARGLTACGFDPASEFVIAWIIASIADYRKIMFTNS